MYPVIVTPWLACCGCFWLKYATSGPERASDGEQPVRVSHGGFPLISHHTPAVIPTHGRGGICHLPACFLLLFSKAKLSSALLWSFPRLTELLNGGNVLPSHHVISSLRWLLPWPVEVMSFSAMSSAVSPLMLVSFCTFVHLGNWR